MIQNEAELAGVLGHEIIHVTEKHTIKSIQKSKTVQMGASETLSGSSALLEQAVTATYDNIVEKSFGREEENESDEKGVALANKVGYAPSGLGAFLTRLKERNKDAKEKRGLFASHPEMKARLDNLKKQIAAKKLASTATLADRYKKFDLLHARSRDRDRDGRRPAPPGLTGGGRAEEDEPKKEEPKKEEPKKRRVRARADAADRRRREEADAGRAARVGAAGWIRRTTPRAARIRNRCR